jgi:hypothetical protein
MPSKWSRTPISLQRHSQLMAQATFGSYFRCHASQLALSGTVGFIRKLRFIYRTSVYLWRSSEVRVVLVGKSSQLPDVPQSPRTYHITIPPPSWKPGATGIHERGAAGKTLA